MSNLLSNVLNILFNFTNDWGVAIVSLTVIVKVILVPLSIKQKIAISKQQELTSGINEIKKKYKDDESKMNEEINKYYTKNGSSLFGCFIGLLQLPILITLFKVIKTVNIDTGSIIVPWVSSLKSYDTSYIIPIIYTLVSLAPSLLDYMGYLKGFNKDKPLKQNIVNVIVMSIIITFKSPVALGIYLITSGLVSVVEEIIYRLIIKKKRLMEI